MVDATDDEITDAPSQEPDKESQDQAIAPTVAVTASADGAEEQPPPPVVQATEVKKKTLSITIKDEDVLYAAYMPFLKAGGLFIPTKKNFMMGDELTLLITLPGSEERHKVESHIVWITPIGSPGNKAAGIGVEFSEDPEGEAFRVKIENILGTKLQSQDATHTM